MAVGAGLMGMALHRTAPDPGHLEVVTAPVLAAAVLHTSAPSVTVTPAAVVAPRRIPPLQGAAGLTPRALTLAHYLQDTYPAIRSIGGVRPCDSVGEHCRGVALDVMVGSDTELGNRITDDVLAQPGIRYAIYRETYRKPNGYRAWMADRGSPTANHFDHVHIAVAA